MFTGEFEHSLDEKGRVILPVKFRARLESLVLFKGRDGCLYVVTPEEFNRISETLASMGGGARDAQRVIYGSAVEQTLDKQGRMAIPETLRRYAGLERDLTVIGVGGRVEIWARDRWADRSSQADEEYAAFGQANPDLPI